MDFFTRSHLPLDGLDRALGIGNGLSFCKAPDKTFTLFGECNDRGGCPPAFCIGDDNRFSCFHDRHTGKGCSQIDTQNLLFCHFFYLLIFLISF